MEKITSELLSNGFVYCLGSEKDLMDGWDGEGLYVMVLKKHDTGYFIFLTHNVHGGRNEITLGSSGDAKRIIAIRDNLKKLWNNS